MAYHAEKYNLHYLKQIEATLHRALSEHPRTFALRVDLRLPDTEVIAATDAAVISRFTESLKAKVVADLNKKQREGKRVHPCTLRYVWAREFNQVGKKHYHVLLLFNKDTYAFLGDYRSQEGNLAGLITQAWLSALGLKDKRYHSLPYFPENPCYYLNAKTLGTDSVYEQLVTRVSYLAKERSKISNDGERNFGCSQR
ncbi:inovirus Gp2 family protein [Budvicia aquatica]|uniref:Inovirus Gp2 family protein n=1 Tax=Budvicia aquatica TaxID=82979 RepID=A0A2C6DGE1_9GAMM|nr:inovirus Gp2 family protein [Budvicia aquatica]PHI28277.1 inovirus Gp2 family protein [Budvicia aquatica]VFS46165.1 Protein of uncharacterised function (DUF3296) [Budvicia aquatica]